MKTDRWQKIEAVFQAAIDLRLEDRENFLKNECREDFELKTEVEKLLSDFNSAENFIEHPVWTDGFFDDATAKNSIFNSLDQLIENKGQESLTGQRIGVYSLVRELGLGGMGVVYLAERADGEFRQKVAVKLIKRGMDSDFIIKRFRSERQILASFEHQNIARLLDGGTTSSGLPYFVMEYIEGDSLYDFCDKRRLNLNERLEIFQQICSAISYAHQRHIIHRDIKPGNILFTKNGEPKLLDFGIAKVLDTDLIHESVSPTASMMRLMTPDYASPEQVNGNEITPSSDIYSLGILLYELVSGHRPHIFSGKSLHEISRKICEVSPELPSEIIDKEINLLPQYLGGIENIAKSRNTDLETLRKEVSGDLDKIIMKALAKEPAQRYVSVAAFSEDVRRFLAGEKIRAKSLAPKTNSDPFFFGATPGKSLAVLPFEILNFASTADTGDKFFGMGLADALITRLSRIRHFIVRPTSSILAFEEENFDVLKAANDLKVDYVLSGNIKRADERLRVNVQLLDVGKNAAVWAISIDETASDFFSLEDAISNKVVEALVPQITGSDLEEFSKRGTENAEAFEHYLRGRYYFNTSTEEGFAKAFVSFHNAIAKDPTFAHAYAGLAGYYSWLGIFGVLPPQECFQPAIRVAEKAIELDKDLAEAHSILGFAVHAGNYDQEKAEYHLNKALELNPNYANAYAWLSIIWFAEGRFREGLLFATRAADLDPLTPYNHHNTAWGMYYARRFDESIRLYKKSIADFPAYGLNYYGLSKNLRFIGETQEAITQIEKAKEFFGESVFIKLAVAESFAANGDLDKAKEIIQNLQNLSDGRYVSPYQLALVYCYLKDKEKALEFIEKAFEVGEAWLNWIKVEPVFDFLNDEPRFQKIVSEIKRKISESSLIDLSNAETEVYPLLEAETAEYPTEHKRKIPNILKYALVITLVFILGFSTYILSKQGLFAVSYENLTKNSWSNNFLSGMNVKRLTTNGKSNAGAISPDGKLFAYTVKKDEQQSLWIRSVDDEEEDKREIVPLASVYYTGVTFSPDAKYVYYSTFSSDYTIRLLHRIETKENSEPQKILDYVNSKIDFTADGKTFAFYSFNTETRIMSLQIAEIDAEEGAIISTKTLATQKQPNYFSGNPTFAADGKKIAYAIGQTVEKKISTYLKVFDLETNSELPLGEKFYGDIMSIAWHGDADEVVFSASEKENAPYQLLLAKYPGGETSPLTNDLSSYFEVSIAKNADILIAAKRQKTSSVWSGDLKNTANAVQLTEGTDRLDGFNGLALTPDGEIIYIGGNETESNLALINADGTNHQVIKSGVASPMNPSITFDNRYIIFGGSNDGESNVWRYDRKTKETKRLVPNFALTPTITPEGKFVIYSANNPNRKVSLHKIPIEGGESVALTENLSVRPVVSPDGSKILCYYSGKETNRIWKIAVLPIDGGEPLQIVELPDTVNLLPPPSRPLAWSPDGNAIFYINDKGDASNIYKIDLRNGAKPEELTNFNSGIIFDFALMQKEKRLIFARGTSTSDIVMFRKMNNE